MHNDKNLMNMKSSKPKGVDLVNRSSKKSVMFILNIHKLFLKCFHTVFNAFFPNVYYIYDVR